MPKPRHALQSRTLDTILRQMAASSAPTTVNSTINCRETHRPAQPVHRLHTLAWQAGAARTTLSGPLGFATRPRLRARACRAGRPINMRDSDASGQAAWWAPAPPGAARICQPEQCRAGNAVPWPVLLSGAARSKGGLPRSRRQERTCRGRRCMHAARGRTPGGPDTWKSSRGPRPVGRATLHGHKGLLLRRRARACEHVRAAACLRRARGTRV